MLFMKDLVFDNIYIVNLPPFYIIMKCINQHLLKNYKHVRNIKLSVQKNNKLKESGKNK